MAFVQTDVRIHYDVVGDGPPVLWHTGGCGDGRMWQLAGYLDAVDGYTHVVMDHRGRGESEAPRDAHGHRMTSYVADALAVLDDAGVDRAAFVGYSFGARVGFAAAEAAPRRLAGLIALDSYPDPSVSAEEVREDAAEVRARGTRDVIAQFVSEEREPVPGWLVEHLSATDTAAFAGSMEAEAEAEAVEPDVWAAAGSVDVPVLLVLGLEEGDTEQRLLGERFVAALPDARLATLDVAHLAAFHRTDLTVPLLREFLGRVTTRAAD